MKLEILSGEDCLGSRWIVVCSFSHICKWSETGSSDVGLNDLPVRSLCPKQIAMYMFPYILSTPFICLTNWQNQLSICCTTNKPVAITSLEISQGSDASASLSSPKQNAVSNATQPLWLKCTPHVVRKHLLSWVLSGPMIWQISAKTETVLWDWSCCHHCFQPSTFNCGCLAACRCGRIQASAVGAAEIVRLMSVCGVVARGTNSYALSPVDPIITCAASHRKKSSVVTTMSITQKTVSAEVGLKHSEICGHPLHQKVMKTAAESFTVGARFLVHKRPHFRSFQATQTLWENECVVRWDCGRFASVAWEDGSQSGRFFRAVVPLNVRFPVSDPEHWICSPQCLCSQHRRCGNGEDKTRYIVPFCHHLPPKYPTESPRTMRPKGHGHQSSLAVDNRTSSILLGNALLCVGG